MYTTVSTHQQRIHRRQSTCEQLSPVYTTHITATIHAKAHANALTAYI